MANLFPSQKIYLAPSRIHHAGRGIFARVDIIKDEVIESCPILEFPSQQIPILKKTDLLNYYFLWGKEFDQVAICFGFGSLYNHSYQPNATYLKKMTEKLIDFVAIQDIKKDEEITVNYNHGDPNDKSPLWITDIPPAE